MEHHSVKSRFAYVKYDEKAVQLQSMLLSQFACVEAMINGLPDGRAKALAMTKLEETYMWVGKAIRDDQVQRNPDSLLQEERKNG